MKLLIGKVVGDTGPEGPPGDKGESGASAYEIAKANGYEGTEEEWLEEIQSAQSKMDKNNPTGTGTFSMNSSKGDNTFNVSEEGDVTTAGSITAGLGGDIIDGKGNNLNMTNVRAEQGLTNSLDALKKIGDLTKLDGMNIIALHDDIILDNVTGNYPQTIVFDATNLASFQADIVFSSNGGGLSVYYGVEGSGLNGTKYNSTIPVTVVNIDCTELTGMCEVYVHCGGTNVNLSITNIIGEEIVQCTNLADVIKTKADSTAIDNAKTSANIYTDEKIAELINGAPTTLDTLKEIADAMAENEDVVEALNEAIGSKADAKEFDSHVANTSNPHSVTKEQIGLGNVDNTADADKTVAKAKQLNSTQLVNKNIDELLTAGLEYWAGANNGCTGDIPSGTVAFNLKVFRNAGSYLFQRLINQSGIIFTRAYMNSAWTEWSKIATADDLSKYLPLTGGTLSGDTMRQSDSASLVNWGVKNPLHEGGLRVSSAGNLGIWSETLAKWLIYATPSGEINMNGNANTATKAEQDTNGDIIPDTYMTQSNPVSTGSFSMNRKANTVIGEYSSTFGDACTASEAGAHAEGAQTIASGIYSHAEGWMSKASADQSHAEGYNTEASGPYSHAEGASTIASGTLSHAGGFKTVAAYETQTVIGYYNNNKEENIFEVGNGVKNTPSNALELSRTGDLTVAGEIVDGNGNSLTGLNSRIGDLSKLTGYDNLVDAILAALS